ncbi:hypothetical protein PTSG_08413 [Salpingoeca rosetta]|uniref:DAGKc domain-containing protein n=1 Tax=Salpingoeca rosetta (strain ATCC 50818 / BSB-021) TaxID=946362 RepID=F2UJL9_SALR5|nr:uncharacterized protein PTSG_08413 [Salpingoeca rosetta]EGD77318.1 hypothetical protein PTSG_08413 [Salpingoeca rosetta]|eukprot:XP_004990662.1 hypothetical protein PTSG_08413 [Salpingoeca rosetta]
MALVEVEHKRKRWLCYAVVEPHGLAFVGHDKYSNRTILWNDIISFKLGGDDDDGDGTNASSTQQTAATPQQAPGEVATNADPSSTTEVTASGATKNAPTEESKQDTQQLGTSGGDEADLGNDAGDDVPRPGALRRQHEVTESTMSVQSFKVSEADLPGHQRQSTGAEPAPAQQASNQDTTTTTTTTPLLGPQNQGPFQYHHRRQAVTTTATIDFVHTISKQRLRRTQYTITASADYIAALAEATHTAMARYRSRRHYLILINPVSGRRKGVRRARQLMRHFHDAGLGTTEHITRDAGEARRMLAELDLDTYDAVVVVGGDGFLNEAVLGLMTSTHGHTLPVGIIPAGSTNTVARSCYGTDEPLTCALHAIRGKELRMDACRVQGSVADQEVWTTYALNFVSNGFFSETLRISENCRCCGPPRYQFAGIQAFLRNKSFRARVSRTHGDSDMNNSVTDTIDYAIIGLALMPLKTPDSKLGLVPHAIPGSGEMHQLLLKKTGRFNLLRFLTRTASNGTQYRLSPANCVSCKAMTYHADSPREWNVDGELLVAQSIKATLEEHAWCLLQWDNDLDESMMTDYSALSESYQALSREHSRRTYRIAIV